MNIKRNVSEIRRLIHERKENMEVLTRFLVTKGIAEEVALEILSEGAEISHLTEGITQKVRVTGELSFDKPHRIALIGPTGVGKTTTLIKLAEHYLKQKRNVSVTSLDNDKKGDLYKWAERRRIPFIDSVNSSKADLVLIDTEGCNYYQPNRVEALGDKLAACGDNINLVLTLSAAAKDVDLYGAVHQFSPLAPSSLAFTKLDETLAAGVMINICAKTDLPIRYISYGYPLPGELQVADAKMIARKIMTDFNKDEFQFIRQMTLL